MAFPAIKSQAKTKHWVKPLLGSFLGGFLYSRKLDSRNINDKGFEKKLGLPWTKAGTTAATASWLRTEPMLYWLGAVSSKTTTTRTVAQLERVTRSVVQSHASLYYLALVPVLDWTLSYAPSIAYSASSYAMAAPWCNTKEKIPRTGTSLFVATFVVPLPQQP